MFLSPLPEDSMTFTFSPPSPSRVHKESQNWDQRFRFKPHSPSPRASSCTGASPAAGSAFFCPESLGSQDFPHLGSSLCTRLSLHRKPPTEVLPVPCVFRPTSFPFSGISATGSFSHQMSSKHDLGSPVHTSPKPSAMWLLWLPYQDKSMWCPPLLVSFLLL